MCGIQDGPIDLGRCDDEYDDHRGRLTSEAAKAVARTFEDEVDIEPWENAP